jgi:hypothetical protein
MSCGLPAAYFILRKICQVVADLETWPNAAARARFRETAFPGTCQPSTRFGSNLPTARLSGNKDRECFWRGDNCDMRLHHSPSRVPALTPAILAIGCKPTVSHDEIAQVWSPNGQVVATLFDENGGATTSFGYEVELSGKDSSEPKPVARLYGAQRNDGAYGANLRWENNNTLIIECLKTKTPPTISGPVDLGGQKVEVVLRTRD